MDAEDLLVNVKAKGEEVLSGIPWRCQARQCRAVLGLRAKHEFGGKRELFVLRNAEIMRRVEGDYHGLKKLFLGRMNAGVVVCSVCGSERQFVLAREKREVGDEEEVPAV